MNKTRIIKFLDSLEERGIMAADQQSVVLRAEMNDVVAGDNAMSCSNESPDTCRGANGHCVNSGSACTGALNATCINVPSGDVKKNVSTEACK